MLAAQLLYRTNVLGCKTENKKLLLLSSGGKQISVEQLKTNVQGVFDASATYNSAEDEGIPDNSKLRRKDERKELITQKVEESNRKREATSVAPKGVKSKKRVREYGGKTILHRWEDENGAGNWYKGHVHAREGRGLYQVDYEGEEAMYDVDLDQHDEADIIIMD
jgi:hypothetical protein